MFLNQEVTYGDYWVWMQDRDRSLFFAVLTPHHIVCYKHTTSEEQHDLELKKFEEKFPNATVMQFVKKKYGFHDPP